MKKRTLVQFSVALTSAGLVSAGCAGILDIKDVPDEASDGGALADGSLLSNDGGETKDATSGGGGDDGGKGGGDDAGADATGTDCVASPSVEADVNNCGSCGNQCPSTTGKGAATCFRGACGVADVLSDVPSYATSSVASGTGAITSWQQLAADDAQRVLEIGATSASVVDSCFLASAASPASHQPGLGGAESIVLPVGGSTAPPYVIGGVSNLSYDTIGGNGISQMGCGGAGFGSGSWAVDPSGLALRVATNGAVVSFDDANVTCTVFAGPNDASSPNVAALPVYIGSTTVAFTVDQGAVTTWDPATSSYLGRVAIDGVGAALGGAVAGATEFVYVVPSEIGLVSAATPNAPTVAWHTAIAATTRTAPVITAAGKIIAQTDPNTLSALDVMTGAVTWTLPLPSGYAGSFLALSDGTLWAVVQLDNDRNDVIVELDGNTGAVVGSYSGVQDVVDMIVEAGRIWALPRTGSGAVSFPSPRTSNIAYAMSNWPVAGHDNQRTFDMALTGD